jgi:hypothetical protein
MDGLIPTLWKKMVDLFDRIMTPIFGKSWRTGLFAALAFISEASQQILDFCKDYGINEKWLHIIAWAFLMIAFLHAKDKQVTGGSVKQ